MMLKTLTVLVLLATVYAQEHDDIDEFVKDIFGATNPPHIGTNYPGSTGPSVMESEGEKPCNEKVAKCVRYYLCDYQYQRDNKEITDQIQSTASDSYCPSYLDTCCLFDAILPEPAKHE